MQIQRKDATITPTGTDGDFPGTFEVILSAPTLDRDGDTLKPDEWKMPLPDHITFDSDHGMSVASTVGSGVPTLDPITGEVRVAGTYSSLPRAQEVRTLVNEGHIRTTSVAFLTMPKSNKDAKAQRELLNGAFVAIPSNREALVLSSKGLGVKLGARNSASDATAIQAIHDHAIALGAKPADMPMKGLGRKDAETEDQSDPAALIAGVDATIDEAIDLFAQVDVTALPAEVQQAIALIQAADATIDELMDTLGITDPDEPDSAVPAGADAAPAAGVPTPAAGAKSVPADDVEGAIYRAKLLALSVL
jgi:hypothetical protein